MKKPFRVLLDQEKCAACLGPLSEVWMTLYRPAAGWDAICKECSLSILREAAEYISRPTVLIQPALLN